jgi:hypothetical protein
MPVQPLSSKEIAMRDKPGPTLKPSLHESASARPGDPGHDEWLLDESIEETFPASDPIAPATEPDEKPRKK